MSLRIQKACLIALSIFFYSTTILADDYTQQRQQMIADIDGYVKTTVKAINKKTIDENIMQVMRTIPRHEFVPQDLRSRA
jgi:protein-L-isoaspartate(D-aspartate) O-methyltransferase